MKRTHPKELAQEFNVSPTTIGDILTGRRWGWLAPLFFLFVLCQPPLAMSHDWYTGQHNIYGAPCCYGPGMSADCGHIPPESLREVKGGYIVTLTKEQMIVIRPALGNAPAGSPFARLQDGISEFIPAAEAKPALDGAYSACINGYPRQINPKNPKLYWILCFFFPTNS